MELNKHQITAVYRACLGFISDRKRKDLLDIIKDFGNVKHDKLNLNYKNYFKSLMYKKDAGDLSNYFDGEMLYKIKKSFVDKGKHPILHNKIQFANIMMKNDIPIANYIGCIKSGKLLDKNNNITASIENEAFEYQINKWLAEYKTIFIKPADSFGGAGILKFEIGEVFCLSKINVSHDYIIEQGLLQHSALNKINPNCINSHRIISVRFNNEIFIPSSLLRMGISNSFVDNASAGGMFVNYDLDNKAMGLSAHTFAQSGGKSYDFHPDTKFVFKNKTLPYPEKVVLLIKKAANVLTDIDLIGWDIAYTEHGPVVLEGNTNPCFEMNQISLKGLNTNLFYKEYFDSLKNDL